MGSISPEVYKSQQEQMQAAADAALAAQYQSMGIEPPQKPFIEGEFEVVSEPKKLNGSAAFFGMGDPEMDRLLGKTDKGDD